MSPRDGRLMPGTILHFGGNGHSACRLDRVRDLVGLVDVPYPGFEGRPRSRSLDAFLGHLSGFCRSLPEPPVGVVASGIGALLALGLRARGDLIGVPMVFQGPVLWGLKDRWFPRIMRVFPPARGLLKVAFGSLAFRARFARKQFTRPVDRDFLERFFQGYQRCSAFGDFFEWLTPGWLRSMEADFRARPEALERITVWVGGRDHVVGLAEVRTTERALGVTWTVEVFEEWGHYPMIDVPEEWAHALRRTLASA